MRPLVTFYLTLITVSSLGQTYFLFEQKRTDEISAIEQRFDSKRLSTEKSYVSEDLYPLADKYELEFPISYLRTGDTLISNCHVQYYFTSTDSKIRLIVYDWDMTKTTDRLDERAKIMKEERHRFQAYNSKYDQLFEMIEKTFGVPQTDVKLKETIARNAAYKERTTKWQRGDITIKQSLIFTTSDNEWGTFRVRVTVYWE